MLVPQAHQGKAFGRYLPLTRELVWFVGWFAAEGSLSRNQVSLNLGSKDRPFVSELQAAVKSVFGEKARVFQRAGDDGFKLYFNSVQAARLLRAWGLAGPAHRKQLPNVLFSLGEALQFAFLEGYFLGDGTLGGSCATLVTNSPDLKEGLLYLFGQLGLVMGTTAYQPRAASDPRIQTKQPFFALNVSGKHQLRRCEPMWHRHASAARLQAYLARPSYPLPAYRDLGADLIGLEVVSAEEIAPIGEYVYDLSVQDDENFVCGSGGLCAHNTDADVDGAHIRTLLLTFFFRQMRQVVTDGYLYIAQPPLFKISHGKEIYYAQSEAQRDEAIAEIKEKHKNVREVDVQRYKGLGEMNPEQLWDTTMNPATRTLLRVNMDDAAQADEIFDMLMGDQVPPRKKFIQTHAKYVRNLDV
jgi:DNA gyrase subunit B